MSKKDPFLSVIVPAYNIEQYVEQCIESILNQTYTNFELILVDDGSTDHTGILCDKYAHKDTRVFVIHKENGGLVSARKAGLMASKGEYISYVDGDDWIENNTLEVLCDSAYKEEADIVITDFVYVFPDRKQKLSQNFTLGTYTKEQFLSQKYASIICMSEYFSFGLQPSLCSKLFKKEILYKHQMAVNDDIRLGEDAACFYPCIFESKKVTYLQNHFLYNYRMRELSISHSIHKVYYTEEIILLIDHLYNDIITMPDNLELLKQLWLYYCYMVDNMITPHLSFWQIFFDSKLYKQCQLLKNHPTWITLYSKFSDLRTSSRMKRIMKLIESQKVQNRINIFLFRIYETYFSKH